MVQRIQSIATDPSSPLKSQSQAWWTDRETNHEFQVERSEAKLSQQAPVI